MKTFYCVYKHTTPNNKVYIGITSKNPLERWNNGHGYASNKHFTNAIMKYGWDNIQHEILFEGLTKEEACQKEIELIAFYKSNNCEFGYNRSSGGEWSAIGAYKVLITHEGKTQSIEQWSAKTGICKGTLYDRYKKWWDSKQILETVVAPHETIEIKVCEYCGELFKPQRNSQKCCSPQCANALRIQEHTKICPTCCQPFHKTQNVYCSHECAMKAQRTKPIQTCAYCGKEFIGENYRKSKYCSKDCYIKSRWGK